MLVQSKSKSCGTCQKRKIKCDRNRPSCSQCIKDDWSCPGYPIAFKRRARSGDNQAYEHDQQWPGSSNASQLAHNIPAAIPRLSLYKSLNSTKSLLGLQLVSYLEMKNLAGMHITDLGGFVEFIPQRLGSSQALDDAVLSISGAYASFLRSQQHFDRTDYFKALKSLRKAVLNPEEALSSNTLAAAVLLSWYEIIADNLDDSWLDHIRGCGHLIQLRGAARHQSGFGKALFITQEGFISTDAFIQRKPNFLDSDDWKGTIAAKPKFPSIFSSDDTWFELSSVLSGMDPFMHDQREEHLPEFQRLLLRFRGMHREIKKTLNPLHDPYERHGGLQLTALTHCKNAVAIFILNNKLQHVIYGFWTKSLARNLVVPLNPEDEEDDLPTEVNLWMDFLQHEIEEALDSICSSSTLAAKATPFSTRKFAFMCRYLSKERGSICMNRKFLWDQLELSIDGLRAAEQNMQAKPQLS